jgi:hypothetical protein
MNNFNANQVDQPFETPRKVSQIDQKHLRTEKKFVSHKTLQATPIIPSEVQIGEA